MRRLAAERIDGNAGAGAASLKPAGLGPEMRPLRSQQRPASPDVDGRKALSRPVWCGACGRGSHPRLREAAGSPSDPTMRVCR